MAAMACNVTGTREILRAPASVRLGLACLISRLHDAYLNLEFDKDMDA